MVEDYTENYGSGWISLYRSIKNHWIFDNDKYFKWWILMLFEVNHSERKMVLGYKIHNIKRGESSNSLRTWANLFNTGVKSVTKFFSLLESDGMITKKTIGKGKQSTTLINITNYTDYQPNKETLKTTQRGTQGKRKGVHKVPTNNNDNNYNNGNNENNNSTNVLVKKVFTSYNIFADKYNIPKIKKETPARKKLVKSRLKNPEDLKVVFKKISESDFLLSSGFISFDWIFKQANFNKILEGNYDNSRKKELKKDYGARADEIYQSLNN